MSRFDLGVYHLQNYGLWIVKICQRTRRNEFFFNFHCLHQTSKACLQLSSWTSRRSDNCYNTMVLLFGIDYCAVKKNPAYMDIQFTAICLKGMILIRSYNSNVLTLQRIGGI